MIPFNSILVEFLTLARVAAKIIGLKRVIVLRQSAGHHSNSEGNFLGTSTFLILIQKSANAFDCDALPARGNKGNSNESQ